MLIDFLNAFLIGLAVGVIRKSDGGYSVFSEHSGKRLSKPGSMRNAKKRLRQIEYFKHRDMKRSHSRG